MDKKLIAEGRPAEILLVDDNRGDALLASHAFREARVQTNLTVASTGETALAMLAGEGEYRGGRLPDLIMLDLGLPKMSGVEVLSHIKSDIRFRHIPVIVMSNSGAGSNILKSYQLYANAYVIKPVDLQKFREAISLIEQFFFLLACVPSQNIDA
jgi:CheY-like chemotaxis protein